MTTAARPFAVTLPDSVPLDTLYPGAGVGESELLEHQVGLRRLGLEKRLRDGAATLGANPHLSWDGALAKWTEEVAVPVLADLNEDARNLAGMELALIQRGQAIVAREFGRMPHLSDAERVALVEAFRRAPSDIKERARGAAGSGQDPTLARAIVESHPLLSGLEEFEIAAIRAGALDHLSEAPAVAREREGIELRIGAVQVEARAVENLRRAIIAQADRSRLTPEVLPRKGDMTAEQASLFMLDHGFETYRKLLD